MAREKRNPASVQIANAIIAAYKPESIPEMLIPTKFSRLQGERSKKQFHEMVTQSLNQFSFPSTNKMSQTLIKK